jgi:hypothetical protein
MSTDLIFASLIFQLVEIGYTVKLGDKELFCHRRIVHYRQVVHYLVFMK